VLEPEVFRKQMHCFEKSAHGIVVAFCPPAVNRRQENCAPLPTS